MKKRNFMCLHETLWTIIFLERPFWTVFVRGFVFTPYETALYLQVTVEQEMAGKLYL